MSAAIKQESRAYFRALGLHLSALRKQQGMTQAELARMLGVSQQTVFAYELGDRRVSVLTLTKLAETFEVPVEQLIRLMKPAPKTVRVEKTKLAPAGVRFAQRFQSLTKTQQRFVARIMEVLLEYNRTR